MRPRDSEWAWAEDDALINDLGGLLAYTIKDAAEAMGDWAGSPRGVFVAAARGSGAQRGG